LTRLTKAVAIVLLQMCNKTSSQNIYLQNHTVDGKLLSNFKWQQMIIFYLSRS